MQPSAGRGGRQAAVEDAIISDCIDVLPLGDRSR